MAFAMNVLSPRTPTSLHAGCRLPKSALRTFPISYSMKRYLYAIRCLQQAENFGNESAACYIAHCRKLLS